MSMHFDLLLPAWLTMLLALALLGAIAYGTMTLLQKGVARKFFVILTLIRVIVFVLFLLILLQPALTYTSQAAQLPELVVLVDTSRSMGQASGKGTRLGEVTAHLRQGEFAAALRGRYHAHWFAFHRSARPIDADKLATLKADGTNTQLAHSIDTALTHARSLGKNPQRLLLVSDGLDRGQSDPVEAARRFGVTIDVLAPSSPSSSEAPALEIVEVQSARRVLLASDTIFRITINGKRPADSDRNILIRATEDGNKVLERNATLKAGRVEDAFEITYKPLTAGPRQLDFSLADAAARPYPVSLQVLDSKYEVLILEDRWRWEYKYLHRLFEDDPSFRFWALLQRGKGTFQRFGSPDSRISLVGFPQNRTDLEGFDTFVLGDVDPAKWPRDLAKDLANLIADEGRSLVVIAGPSVGRMIEIPELHALLPVELTPDSGKPIEGPIDVRMRPDAADSPFFFQLRTADAEKLTPLDQVYPALRKRPGATVLLEALKHRNAYGNTIVIAEHTVGRGRVLFVGTDTFWKWHTLASTSEGPTPYSIFWQQAIRALTPARSNAGPVTLW
ncbi:MAG TPA: vWA domain-containing protein, partial [Gemmataceae bacterium]|nr:vWA domain-containing protein [Gemmataceae bacterium]